MSSLEAELTKALEDTAQLEDRNTQLSQQLYDLRDKVRTRPGTRHINPIKAWHRHKENETLNSP